MGDHYRQLSVEERVNIMLRLRDGMSSRAIARELKHAPSMIKPVITTIERTLVRRMLGRLKDEDQNALNQAIRADNETGKGDHRHRGAGEEPYGFSTLERLVADFFADVTRWRDENSNP